MHFQARSLPRSTFEPDVNAELENKPLTIARPVYLESENRAEKRYEKKEKRTFFVILFLLLCQFDVDLRQKTYFSYSLTHSLTRDPIPGENSTRIWHKNWSN